jgi:hypothetical protein
MGAEIEAPRGVLPAKTLSLLIGQPKLDQWDQRRIHDVRVIVLLTFFKAEIQDSLFMNVTRLAENDHLESPNTNNQQLLFLPPSGELILPKRSKILPVFSEERKVRARYCRARKLLEHIPLKNSVVLHIVGGHVHERSNVRVRIDIQRREHRHAGPQRLPPLQRHTHRRTPPKGYRAYLEIEWQPELILLVDWQFEGSGRHTTLSNLNPPDSGIR